VITQQALLDFWFADGANVKRPIWFQVNAAFDSTCGALCADMIAPAREGALDHWARTPSGTLALLLLLDQMPRNINRGTADAYASDSKARAVARDAVSTGFDRQLTPVQRTFIYLPFEHAENLPDQDYSVELFTALCATPDFPNPERTIDFVHRHRDVIRRYGRFPHRNAALNRISTVAEADYLARPGAGF